MTGPGAVPPRPGPGERPTVVLDPAPRTTGQLFTPAAAAVLHERFDVVDLSALPVQDRSGALDAVLPRAFAVVGQPDLPRERLDRAPHLRALLNVEGTSPTSTTRPASSGASTCWAAGPPTPRRSPSTPWA